MDNAINRTVVRMRDFRPRVNRSVRSLRRGARSAAQSTEGFVRENPWAAIGIAVAAGLLAGVGTAALRIVSSRRDADAADDAVAATSG